MRNVCHDSHSIAPMPLRDPTISTPIVEWNATFADSRSPVSMSGIPRGSSACRNICRRSAPKLRASSRCTGFIPRTLATVLSSVGKNAPEDTAASLLVSPTPSTTISSGKNTSRGIGCSAATSGSSTRRSRIDVPIASPIVTPAPPPQRRPSRIRLIVAPRCDASEPFTSISPSDTATAAGAGRKKLDSTPQRTRISRTARIASQTKKKRTDQRVGSAAGTVAWPVPVGTRLMARARPTARRAAATRPRR